MFTYSQPTKPRTWYDDMQLLQRSFFILYCLPRLECKMCAGSKCLKSEGKQMKVFTHVEFVCLGILHHNTGDGYSYLIIIYWRCCRCRNLLFSGTLSQQSLSDMWLCRYLVRRQMSLLLQLHTPDNHRNPKLYLYSSIWMWVNQCRQPWNRRGISWQQVIPFCFVRQTDKVHDM